jgi:hypothetical protein
MCCQWVDTKSVVYLTKKDAEGHGRGTADKKIGAHWIFWLL